LTFNILPGYCDDQLTNEGEVHYFRGCEIDAFGVESPPSFFCQGLVRLLRQCEGQRKKGKIKARKTPPHPCYVWKRCILMRQNRMNRWMGAVSSGILGALLLAAPAAVCGHIPDAVAALKPNGRLAGTNRLDLAVGLPLRNGDKLTRLLQQIYDPASPNYRHYLTPEQFTEQFGPAYKDYQAVIAFAGAHGLKVGGTHANRMLLDVSGAVADIEQAFHVKMQVYQHPTEQRTFYAPDREPTLDLATPVLNVIGLDNYAVPHPCLRPMAPRQPKPNLTGSGPSGAYLGSDFRAAYVPGVTLTGSGQTVGLLEFDSGYYQSDITAYETLAGLPNVPVTPVLLDGYGGGPGDGNDEVSLDIEMAISMAPGLTGVLVYEGSVTDDILNRMATDNLAKQIGASWSYSIDATSEQIFMQFAAQGQTFFNASGDSDAYPGASYTPCDDPNITIVGGTTLTTSGPGGAWVSETVWNWGNEYGPQYNGVGSSGGVSTRYPIPSWQINISMSANQGSATMRNLPDVALTADNVYVRYGGGQSGAFGGTSCATPLWAAFTALVNEQAVMSGRPLVGFINPALDTICSGGSYTSCFHDITTGNNTWSGSPGKFYAVEGYDLCTGWGVPTGQNLINALATPDPLEIQPGTGFTAIGASGGPFTVTSESFVLTNSGTNGLTWTATTNSTWLSISPVGGTLAAGGAVTTAMASLNAAAYSLPIGNYTAVVAFSNVTSGIVQSRQFTLQVVPSEPPTIVTQPAGQTIGVGSTATFSVTAEGTPPFAYQWSDDGTNIVNATNSSLTLTNVSFSAAGSYSVMVSNTFGMTNSTNADLKVVTQAPFATITYEGNATAYSFDGSTWTASPGGLPSEAGWSRLAYGGGVFETIAYGGKSAVYSIDGISWTASPEGMPAVANWQCLAYGNGMFVATVWGGTNVAYCTNGINWVASPGGMPSAADWYCLTYGNGMFVAIGYGGTAAAYSSNGINWTASPTGMPYSANWQSVAYGNGAFVAVVGGSSDAAYSTNGINWMPGSGLPQNNWTSVIYGDNKFVAIAYDSSQMAYSTNGASWATSTMPVSAPWYNSAYGNGVFVVNTWDGNAAAYSADGVNWTSSPGGLPTSAYWIVAASTGPSISISTQPQSTNAVQGQNVTLSVTAAGTAPFSYQWQFDSTNIASATNASLALIDVQLTNAGIYDVIVGNVAGSVTSSNAVLVVGYPPAITNQPQSQMVLQGADAEFTVGVSGTGPLSYQWYYDGLALAQSTNSILALSDVQLTNSGFYSVVVSSPFGSVLSSNATLTVDAPPIIVTQPASLTVGLGSTATFNVTAEGTPPFAYRWSDNGTNIINATNSSLTLTNVTLSEAGSYSVMVSNTFGATNSANADLTVTTQPPFATIAYEGNAAAYSFDGSTWTASPGGLPSAAGWSRLAYGGGVFETIAYGGKSAVYSTNGINWTASPEGMPSVTNWQCLAYGNGKFVATVWGGTNVAYSTNGINWMASPGGMPSAVDWYCLTYGNGMFVAIGYGGSAAAYSTNGINWTASPIGMPYSANWQSVAYGNGAFVAVVGGSSDAAYSTNGINWMAGSGLPHNNWTSVTYGKNTFVAIAYDSSQVAYSTNGASWATSTMPASAPWYNSAYGNGVFVVNTWDDNGAAYSTDGVNWTSSPGGLPTSAYWIVAASNGPSISILTQPQSTNGVQGQVVAFSVTASGLGPLSYQWRFNNTNIAYATNASLLLTNVQVTNDGAYSVIVSNWVASAASSNAVLTVDVPPAILIQPGSQTVTTLANATFRVFASGAPRPSFLWQVNGVNVPAGNGNSLLVSNMPGGFNASLTISNVVPSDGGSYSVIVSNSAGSVVSSNAVLLVNYFVATAEGQPQQIPTTNLTLPSSVQPGNTFTVSSVDPASQQGGPVVLTNGTINYTPPVAFTGLDIFDYVLTPASGPAITGSVTVVVDSSFVISATVSGSQVTIQFAGIPGTTYSIEASTDLVTWTVIGSVTANPEGLFQFQDATVGLHDHRYYRTSLP
jgi:sulfur relay (sulfurtransferase) DsrF/TusC family protein